MNKKPLIIVLVAIVVSKAGQTKNSKLGLLARKYEIMGNMYGKSRIIKEEIWNSLIDDIRFAIAG